MIRFLASLSALVVMSLLSCAQSDGALTVTATTSNAGGNYAPKNIVAIWIEDENGNFVKTLMAYAQTRKTHLNMWEASTTAAGSPFNTVDAITGATSSGHDTRTCTWNSRDINGNLMPDGNYKVRMELTDKNGTGNFSSFLFVKGPDAQNLNPLNVPSFSSISIDWEPVITGVNEKSDGGSVQVFPNPSAGLFRISGDDILEINVFNTSGKMILQTKDREIDLSARPSGIYLLRIHTGLGIVSKKIYRSAE